MRAVFLGYNVARLRAVSFVYPLSRVLFLGVIAYGREVYGNIVFRTPPCSFVVSLVGFPHAPCLLLSYGLGRRSAPVSVCLCYSLRSNGFG